MAWYNRDPFDGKYIGNIWGWKFSLFGLVLILIFVGIMLYRHVVLGVPFGMQEGAKEKVEINEIKEDDY